MNNKDWALFYLKQMKWSVIPVGYNHQGQHGFKAPLINSWKEYQTRLPSEQEVIDWWTKNPNAKIGVLTGLISKLVVVDVDDPINFPKTGIDLPETLKAKTKKGWHFYYFSDKKVDQSPIKYKGNQVGDLKAEGGYVIAPPSKHHNSEDNEDFTYEWQKLPGECQVAEFKPFTANNNVVITEKQDFTSLAGGVQAGGRNNGTASFVGGLIVSMDQKLWSTKAWEATLAWNKANRPPLNEEELKNTFNSICHKELKRREKEAQEKEDYWNGLIGNNKSSKDFNGFNIFKGNEILKMAPSAVPFIVENMIAEKTITAITAKSGVGKSLFALILSTHIASGEKLFDNFNVLQRNVLIIDQEMPDDILVCRYKAIVKKELPIDYVWQQSWLIEDETHFEWLKQAIKDNNYGVIIFDMLDSIHEKNENDNSEMKIINKKLIRLINETGVTIILLHQHRKEDNRTKSSQDSAQGAGDIIHKASSHLIIEQLARGKDPENNMEVTDYLLKQVKSRRPETMPTFKFETGYHLDTKKTEWGFVSFHDDNVVAVEKARNAVLEFLRENSGIWYAGSKRFPTQDLIPEVKKKAQVGDRNIREAIKSLAKENLINSIGKSPVGYFVE